MRWGEPTRLPPLRRGRGLTAAALLTVGLVAAYVVLAVLSLTSVAPSTLLKNLPATIGGAVSPAPVKGPPKVRDYITPTLAASVGSGLESLTVPFGRQQEAATLAINLTNTSVTPVDLQVDVLGAPGVVATFPDSGTTEHLKVHGSTSVAVSTDPLHAGPLHGAVLISMTGAALTGAEPLKVPLTGDQAPLPPGTATAEPTAGGGVHVSWAASPSTGVAGYEVDRRVSGGPWQPVRTLVPAGGLDDETGTDGQTVEYRVSAIAAGVQPALPSLPGGTGSTVTDASPPGPVSDVSVPDVNQANTNAVPVQVFLPQTWAPTDAVSVTLTDEAGVSATGTTVGGQSPVVVPVDASHLTDGSITATATLTDAAGNTTGPNPVGNEATKDTVAPEPPTDVQAPEVVNGDAAAAVPVTVHIADPEHGERVHVQVVSQDDPTNPADQSGDVDGPATTLVVDASKLPDGPLTVSAWSVDEAGNTSKPVDGDPITKDTSAPDASARIHVTGGDRNPQDYVNAASASAVNVAVNFPQATDPADTVVISVGDLHLRRQGGDDTYFVGPLDLTDQPDGPLPLSVAVRDPAGNSATTRDRAIKDTVAPAAPTSFTVPESADNAAGFVNSFNQSAAVIQATFPEGTDSSDTLTASVDGVDLGARVGGSIAVAWRANVSGFADGQLDLHGTITDAARNTTAFSGRAVKETQPPPPPVAAHVIGFCRPDTITPATASNVSVQVVLPDLPGLSGAVTVTLTDSAGHTASGTASGGPGIVVVHGIDASSFVPGHVHLTVSVTDSAGNASTFDGTTATFLDPAE